MPERTECRLSPVAGVASRSGWIACLLHSCPSRLGSSCPLACSMAVRGYESPAKQGDSAASPDRQTRACDFTLQIFKAWQHPEPTGVLSLAPCSLGMLET